MDLTHTEGQMLTILEKLTLNAHSAVARKEGAFHIDVLRARARQYGISYDMTFRALRGLLDKGVCEKPQRGYYRLVEGRR